MPDIKPKLDLKRAGELLFGKDTNCNICENNYNGRSYEYSSGISNKSKGIILLVVGIY